MLKTLLSFAGVVAITSLIPMPAFAAAIVTGVVMGAVTLKIKE